MDEIEGGILSSVPPAALTLNLTRATIKMEHSRTWQIDKSNQVDDLIICLEGRGHYLVDGEARVLEPGDAMLIFRGSILSAGMNRPSPIGEWHSISRWIFTVVTTLSRRWTSSRNFR